jgi:hypothetical protein
MESALLSHCAATGQNISEVVRDALAHLLHMVPPECPKVAPIEKDA